MLNEAMHDTTDLAMNNGRNHGDENLLVKFLTRPKQNQTKSKDAGRPIYEEVAYIQIMQPGNKDSIKLAPATERDKQRFPEHYRKYLAREDQDKTEGTLLSEWAGITRSQVEEFKYMNILTVEQLANVSDSNGQGIMGIGFLKEKALKFMEQAKDGVLSEALEEQRAINAKLLARLDALENDEAPKKRGRPKKVEETDLEE